MNTFTVPLGYWQKACEDMDYPLACVCPDNKFMWVNQAFERMLGYSSAELAGKTWMSITEQQYVGGDLASVEAVISGRISHYTMSKNYINKRGGVVPVELTVHRFPESPIENLICFIVESPPTKATKPELDQVEKNLLKVIEELRSRIDENEKGIKINMGNRTTNETNTVGGDNIGRDKNSDSAIKILGTVMCVMAIAIAWMFYYITVANKAEMPKQPTELVVPK
jgi:PAS domain S-box-containing protein